MTEKLEQILLEEFIRGNIFSERIGLEIDSFERSSLLHNYYHSVLKQAFTKAEEKGIECFNSEERIDFGINGVIKPFLEKLDLKYKSEYIHLGSNDTNVDEFIDSELLQDKTKLVLQISRGIIENLSDINFELFKKPDPLKIFNNADAYEYNSLEDYNKLLRYQEIFKNEGLVVLYKFKYNRLPHRGYYQGSFFGIEPDKENPFYDKAKDALKPLVLETIFGYASCFRDNFKDLTSSQKNDLNELLFFFNKDRNKLPGVLNLYYEAIKNS